MKIRSINELKNLQNKIVLLRADFNVPFKGNKILDDSRLRAAAPTIKHLKKQKATILILTHLGRPEGKPQTQFSNQILIKPLAKILNSKVFFLSGLVEPEISAKIKALPAGSIVMLENLRFYKGEEKNDSAFAKKLASLGDIYVNEAFSVSHRAHASLSAITKYLKAYAGFQLISEVENLNRVLISKDKPKMAVIGGAKLETKIKVIANLLKKMDLVLLGGMIANNAMAAAGKPVGSSKIDSVSVKLAKKIIGPKVLLPSDAAVAGKPDANNFKIKAIKDVKRGDLILDLGPATAAIYARVLSQAKTIVLNGPLGYFENKKFRASSAAVLKAIAPTAAFKVIGGGETLELINDLKLKLNNAFVSTGGGAMLEFLEGKILPGIKPLIKK